MLFRLLLADCLREDNKRVKYRLRNTSSEVSKAKYLENVGNAPIRFDFLSLKFKNRNGNLYTVGPRFKVRVAEVRLSAVNICSELLLFTPCL
jgi:hypothetical protein